jgi:hypothetical protein
MRWQTQFMRLQRYRLALEGGARGGGDIDEIIVLDEGSIRGPLLPNWQNEYLLVRCIAPTSYHGQELRYLVLSPRHEGPTLADLQRDGGIVAIGRILPGAWKNAPPQFEADQIQYLAVATLALLEAAGLSPATGSSCP